MMKSIIGIALFFVTLSGFAQETRLDKDEAGKYVYYEVVEAPGASAKQLLKRAADFVPTAKWKVKFQSKQLTDSSFTAFGSFLINKSVAATLSHPSGEIGYHLSLEVRDQKYRYWLDGFTFTAYARDRYGNFVPSGATVPLERSPGKLNAAEWKNYLEAAAAQTKAYAESLKTFMKDQPVSEKKEGAVVRKW